MLKLFFQVHFFIIGGTRTHCKNGPNGIVCRTLETCGVKKDKITIEETIEEVSEQSVLENQRSWACSPKWHLINLTAGYKCIKHLKATATKAKKQLGCEDEESQFFSPQNLEDNKAMTSFLVDSSNASSSSGIWLPVTVNNDGQTETVFQNWKDSLDNLVLGMEEGEKSAVLKIGDRTGPRKHTCCWGSLELGKWIVEKTDVDYSGYISWNSK